MPIYVYHCPDCDRDCELLRGLRSDEPAPVCPHCAGTCLERRPLTTFAVHSGGGGRDQAHEGLCCGRESRPPDCVPGSCCGHDH